MKYLKIPSVLLVATLVLALCLPVASAVSSVGITAYANGTNITATATADNISGTAYYTWRLRPSYSSNYVQVSSTTSANQYTFVNLSLNTTYYVSVEVRDSSSTQTSTEYAVLTNNNYNYNYGYYGYNNYNYSGVATIIVSSTPLYTSSSTSSTEIMTLNYGAQVNVFSTSGSFAYVSYGNSYGYVSLSALSNQNYYSGYYYDPYYYGYYGSYYNPSYSNYYDPNYYYYTGNYNYNGYYNPYYYNYDGASTGLAKVNVAYNAAVYYGPSSGYGIRGYLASGVTVTTYGTTGDFTAVDYAGSTGYMLTSQLTPLYSSVTNYGAYITATTTVRGSASSYGTNLGIINANTYVTVYGIEGSWARINWQTGYGYVPVANVNNGTAPSASSSITTTATSTKTVIADVVTVRSSASVSGSSVGTLTKGMVVTTSNTSGGWVYVTSGSIQGWVYGENLK